MANTGGGYLIGAFLADAVPAGTPPEPLDLHRKSRLRVAFTRGGPRPSSSAMAVPPPVDRSGSIRHQEPRGCTSGSRMLGPSRVRRASTRITADRSRWPFASVSATASRAARHSPVPRPRAGPRACFGPGGRSVPGTRACRQSCSPADASAEDLGDLHEPDGLGGRHSPNSSPARCQSRVHRPTMARTRSYPRVGHRPPQEPSGPHVPKRD